MRAALACACLCVAWAAAGGTACVDAGRHATQAALGSAYQAEQAAPASAASLQSVWTVSELSVSESSVVLQNGFVFARVALGGPAVASGLVELRGDALGAGNYGANVAPPSSGGSGLRESVVSVRVAGAVGPASSSQSGGGQLGYRVLHNSSAGVEIVVTGMQVVAPAGTVCANVTLALANGSNVLQVGMQGAVTAASAESPAFGVWPVVEFAPGAAFALYDAGMEQGLSHESPQYPSVSPLRRMWAVDTNGGGAISVQDIEVANGSSGRVTPQLTVLQAGTWNGATSALLVPWLAGGVDWSHGGADMTNGALQSLNASLTGWAPTEKWTQGWAGPNGTAGSVSALVVGTTWHLACNVTVGQFAFPPPPLDAPVVGAVEPPASGASHMWTHLRSSDDRFIPAMLSAIYTSSVGVVRSKAHSPHGFTSACLAHPNICYENNWSFYDPDTFFTVAALATSGDPMLWEEAWRILNTTRSLICGEAFAAKDVCTYGQVPHHFVNGIYCAGPDEPYCACTWLNATTFDVCASYVALSAGTMPGPNVFYPLAVLKLAAVTGDTARLRDFAPSVRDAMSFLIGTVDTQYCLANAPGPLWIDTFLRFNFTSDTNAGLVMLLTQVAEMESALGNATGSAAYTSIAAALADSMNQYLWSEDHYVTSTAPPEPSERVASRSHRQLRRYGAMSTPASVTSAAALAQRCNSTTRALALRQQLAPPTVTMDRHDFDSNLLAIVAGVAPASRASAILGMIDASPFSATRGTWVSGLPYTSAECSMGNVGDSFTSMGRIAWAEAISRSRVNGSSGSEGASPGVMRVVEPLVDDLLTNTFMYERYSADGLPAHNSYFPEYPSVIALLVKEILYGVQESLTSLAVAPLLPMHPGRPLIWSNAGVQRVVLDVAGYAMVSGFGSASPEEATRKEIRVCAFADKGPYRVTVTDLRDDAGNIDIPSASRSALRAKRGAASVRILESVLVTDVSVDALSPRFCVSISDVALSRYHELEIVHNSK